MVTIKHDSSREKFYFEELGKEGRLSYSKVNENTLDFKSTYVPPPLRGKGLGEELVKTGLEYAHKKKYKIIPSCWFVRDYIQEHPEYKDLVE